MRTLKRYVRLYRPPVLKLERIPFSANSFRNRTECRGQFLRACGGAQKKTNQGLYVESNGKTIYI